MLTHRRADDGHHRRSRVRGAERHRGGDRADARVRRRDPDRLHEGHRQGARARSRSCSTSTVSSAWTAPSSCRSRRRLSTRGRPPAARAGDRPERPRAGPHRPPRLRAQRHHPAPRQAARWWWRGCTRCCKSGGFTSFADYVRHVESDRTGARAVGAARRHHHQPHQLLPRGRALPLSRRPRGAGRSPPPAVRCACGVRRARPGRSRCRSR